MKTLDLKSLIIGILLTMMVVAFMIIATDSTPRVWDYRIDRCTGSDYQGWINGVDKDGWEVVSVAVITESGDIARPFAVLRRAKAAQRAAWWRFWKQ